MTVNGIGWGLAPVTIRHLPAGDKRIRVSKEGYTTEERTVRLAEGHPRMLDIRLRQRNLANREIAGSAEHIHSRMQLIFEQIRAGGDRNFGYLLGDRDTRQGVLIDPSYSPEAFVQRARDQGLTVTHVINTHGHPDHTNGNAKAAELTAAPVAAFAGSLLVTPDLGLGDEQETRRRRPESSSSFTCRGTAPTTWWSTNPRGRS